MSLKVNVKVLLGGRNGWLLQLRGFTVCFGGIHTKYL